MCADQEQRIAALEDRLNVVELALSELAHRSPAPIGGSTRKLFGIPVILAPDVDDDRIAAAVADLPRGLDSHEVVGRLQADRLLVRAKAGR